MMFSEENFRRTLRGSITIEEIPDAFICSGVERNVRESMITSYKKYLVVSIKQPM